MLSDQVRTPISDDAPWGLDVRYDDDFERLKAEVGKHASVVARTDFDALVAQGRNILSGKTGGDSASSILAANGALDYDGIVELATRILTTKSKHLEVAAYLCMGLLRVRGYEGLAEGLEAYRALIEAYWDRAFPERLEGRKRVLTMLSERLTEGVELRTPEPPERESIVRAVAEARSIDQLLRERIPEEPPSLSKLLTALNEAKDRLPEVVSRPAPSPAATPAAVREPAMPQPAAAVSPARTTPQSEDEAHLIVTRTASYLRTLSPRNVLGYRLLRCVRWDSIEQLPIVQEGRTLISAPAEHHRTRLDSARAAANWPELVAACEDIFYESPNQYWLELPRYEDQALQALGPEYAPIRSALVGELARLLERLPGLDSLSFEDGTPFADASTRDWIAETVRSRSSNGSGAASPVVAHDEDIQEQLDEAEQRSRQGDLAGALHLLQAAQASDSRPRARFARQILMARLCIAHGRAAVARPLLEELDTLSEHAHLKDWEPQICHQIWSLLHRCYQSLLPSSRPPAQEEYEARMERIFDRLCRLDVRLAVREGGPT
jgi:type VI secretion system protein VasJ